MMVVIEMSFPVYTAVSFIEMIVVVFSGVYVLFLNVQSSSTVPPYTAPLSSSAMLLSNIDDLISTFLFSGTYTAPPFCA